MEPDVPELEGDFVVAALRRDGALAPGWDDREPHRGVTLRFVPHVDEGLVSGHDGVNSVSGTYRRDGDDLRVRSRGLVSTLVFHPDEPPLADCLLRVRHVAVEGDAVRLLDDDRAVVLVLRRA